MSSPTEMNIHTQAGSSHLRHEQSIPIEVDSSPDLVLLTVFVECKNGMAVRDYEVVVTGEDDIYRGRTDNTGHIDFYVPDGQEMMIVNGDDVYELYMEGNGYVTLTSPSELPPKRPPSVSLFESLVLPEGRQRPST